MNSPTAQLATFAASLRFEDIPEPVVCRAKRLLVDWFDATVGGPLQGVICFTQPQWSATFCAGVK